MVEVCQSPSQSATRPSAILTGTRCAIFAGAYRMRSLSRIPQAAPHDRAIDTGHAVRAGAPGELRSLLRNIRGYKEGSCFGLTFGAVAGTTGPRLSTSLHTRRYRPRPVRTVLASPAFLAAALTAIAERSPKAQKNTTRRPVAAADFAQHAAGLRLSAMPG